jgi:hypothetical protein
MSDSEYYGDVMSKKISCFIAIAAFSFMSLQAESQISEKQTKETLSNESGHTTDSNKKDLLVCHEKKAEPEALACGCGKGHDKKEKEESEAETQLSLKELEKTPELMACSKCK